MAEKAAALNTMRKVPHWVNGQIYESDSDRYGEVFDSSTGEQCAEVVMANEADVDAAIRSAEDAFAGWSRTPVLRRARVMFRFKELIERDRKEIAAVLTQEHGKVLHDADGSIQRGLEVVEFACGIPHLIKGEYSDQVGTGVDIYSMRQSIGICAGAPASISIRCASRLAFVLALRRSTFLRWCRFGCSRSQLHAETRSF